MRNDLSHYHHPINELFLTEDDAHQCALDAQQLDQFKRDGFLTGIRVLNSAQLEALRSDLQLLMQASSEDDRALWYEYHSNESGDADTVLFHALGGWRLAPSFHDLLWNQAITQPAAQLLEGPVRLWHDQLFCKPAHDGGVVAWHQDYSYWTRTQPMAHLTCWIGLDDSTTENGCLHYVPGSHLWPLLPMTGLAGDMDSIRNVLNGDQWLQFQNAQPVELRAGECAFHHPLTVHGSFENRTDGPRRAAVINFVRDGVYAASGGTLLDNTRLLEAGEPLRGQFFPLLVPSVTDVHSV